MPVKVIPQSDDYRRGYDAIRWGESIADPFLDDPIGPKVAPYGAKPLCGFAVPMEIFEVER